MCDCNIYKKKHEKQNSSHLEIEKRFLRAQRCCSKLFSIHSKLRYSSKKNPSKSIKQTKIRLTHVARHAQVDIRKILQQIHCVSQFARTHARTHTHTRARALVARSQSDSCLVVCAPWEATTQERVSTRPIHYTMLHEHDDSVHDITYRRRETHSGARLEVESEETASAQ
jgi:hypothetical protein